LRHLLNTKQKQLIGVRQTFTVLNEHKVQWILHDCSKLAETALLEYLYSCS